MHYSSRDLFPTRATRYPDWQSSSLLVLVLVGTVAAGVVASTGNVLFAGLFIAAIVGLIVAAFPAVLLWTVIVVALVIAGLTRLYLPEIQQLRWLVPLAALALFGHVILNVLANAGENARPRIPAILWWASVFIAVMAFSTLLNMPDLKTAAIGIKGYFQVWIIIFAVALLPWPSELMDRLPKAFLWIALLQLPFALHQYWFIVPTRIGLGNYVVPLDIVAGTFGADAEGGGLNALLATFQCIVLAGLIALWRQHMLSAKYLLLGIPLLVPLLLNEAKVSLVYVLVLFLVLFRRDIVARPLKFLGIGLAFGVLLSILMAAYTANVHIKHVEDWGDLIKYTYEYNVAKEETASGKLSRWGALTFWAQQHGLRDIPGTLLGHGAGVSRPPDTTAQTQVNLEQVNPEMDRGGIGPTAVAAILWEGGMIALLCVFGLFWAGFRAAGKLAQRHQRDGWRTGLFQGIQASFAVLFVSLWHSNYFVFQPGYQVVLFLLLGYLAYWERRDQMRSGPALVESAGRRIA